MNTYAPSYWSGDNPRVERILSGRTAPPRPSSGTALEEQICSLCRKVADGGDEAVLEATSSFDGTSISSPVVNAAELEDLASRTPQDVKESLDRAMKNSLEFNEKIVSRANWEASSGGSYRYGEIVRPVEAAGLFVPNGKGRFPSVAVQIGCPAVAAGVERLVLASSPCSDDAARLDPAVAYVARRLGVEQVLCANGPALIAALAFGTESVRPVPLIAGPGSAPVVIAQRFVSRFGVQSVPGLGPTDSFIVADATADPVLLAADLINETEHGMDSSAVLVCTDETVTEKAIQYVREQIEELPPPRREYAVSSIFEHGGIFLVDSIADGIAAANEYAPEHLQLAVETPREYVGMVENAGTLLLGRATTFSISNYVAGTPATLPTTGAARVSSGVTAHTYLKRTSFLELDERSSGELGEHVVRLADYESFPAHATSMRIRGGRID